VGTRIKGGFPQTFNAPIRWRTKGHDSRQDLTAVSRVATVRLVFQRKQDRYVLKFAFRLIVRDETPEVLPITFQRCLGTI
jgi:hypothetical protein